MEHAARAGYYNDVDIGCGTGRGYDDVLPTGSAVVFDCTNVGMPLYQGVVVKNFR